MDRVQDGAMKEFLEIIRRAEGEDGGGDAGKRVESLPRTNAEFQTCGLFSTLSDQLEARLGAAVDQAIASDELEIDVGGGARPEAIDSAVARLAASPSFVGVVDTARAAVEQAAGVQTAAAAAAAADGASGSGTATLDTTGSFLRRNVDALSSSDTEREGMHAKKKPARRDDWVGLFDLSGGLDSGGGGFFSPRVDVEAALGQLEAGLESPGGSAASAMEALGLLAEVRGRGSSGHLGVVQCFRAALRHARAKEEVCSSHRMNAARPDHVLDVCNDFRKTQRNDNIIAERLRL